MLNFNDFFKATEKKNQCSQEEKKSNQNKVQGDTKVKKNINNSKSIDSTMIRLLDKYADRYEIF